MINYTQLSKELNSDAMQQILSLSNDSHSIDFGRFSQSQWNRIEKKYSNPIMLTVLNAMCTLGNSQNKFTDEINFTTCGDENYINIIRPELVELNYVKKEIHPAFDKRNNNRAKKTKRTKKTKRNKKKRGLTKEDIIKQNTTNTLTNNMNDVFKSFSSKKINKRGFNSQYAEIRLCTLMQCINYMLTNDVHRGECFELIVGLAKIINNIKQVPGLSKLICYDIMQSCARLAQYSKFNCELLFREYPKFIISTSYDKIFPAMRIKPYESQVSLMNVIKENEKCLCLYSAMIGSGKTTFSMALIKFVEMMRLSKTQDKNLQVIFSCSVEPVRHQVSKMAYNKQIKFGIATIEKNGVKVTNNYNCKSNDERILIVADLNSTVELLKKSQDYILFLDEPTVGADQLNHPITRAVIKIMLYAPSRTILSSATLPSKNEISKIINYITHRHKNIVVASICSKEAIIGCEMLTFDGHTIAPHNNCKTVSELSLVIQRLDNTAFIGRLYTAPVVYNLRKKMIKHNITDAFDLDKHFMDITKLSQIEIQKMAIILLKQLVKHDNNTIKNVCTTDHQDQKQKHNLDNIFTSDAVNFMGGCLITVSDPFEFAHQKSKTLLKDCKSASRIMKKYDTELTAYNKMVNREQKNDTDVGSKLERMKKAFTAQEKKKPFIDFPNELIINTTAHIAFYDNKMNKMNNKKINKRMIRNRQPIEGYPTDLNVPDWTMLLLFAGIGIYDTKKLCKQYTDLVLNLASTGKLAYMIANDDICYGANYPFSHVVITDEVVENHSINTIFQLAGRTGRVGTSWVAWAHVGEKTGKRIMNYIKGVENTGVSEEAKNLENVFTEMITFINNKMIELTKQPKKVAVKKKIKVISLSTVRQNAPVVRSRYAPPNRNRPQEGFSRASFGTSVYRPPSRK